MLFRSITRRTSRFHRSIWAATTVLSLDWRIVAAASGSSASPLACSANSSMSTTTASVPSYPLADKWRLSHDSWLLRFSLPADRPHLGDDPTLPTCVSVQHTDALGDGKVLKKSYSPISHPATVGSFDLLVKSYAPQPGGGVGAGICDLMPGQEIVGKLKAKRVMHGSPVVAKRWDRIGLVAGGTGVAPLVQIIRIVLEDATDTTRIQLLSVNRNEEDILLREELDRLAREHPARFAVRYALTGAAPAGWDGPTGRGSVAMARDALPPPSADGQTTMVFVCGTDGFRDLWAGPGGRDPPKADGSKGAKVQGPLLGILKEAGYEASDVFKY